MAKRKKIRGPRKLSPSERVRLDRSLRLMAGRCMIMQHAYVDLPKDVKDLIRSAHDSLSDAFLKLER